MTGARSTFHLLSSAFASGIVAVWAFELGFAGAGADAAADLGGAFDEEAAAVVGDVAADDAGVDELGALADQDVSLDVAEDVDAAADLDDQVAVDGAADVELAAVDDGDGAGDRAPELDGLVDHDV